MASKFIQVAATGGVISGPCYVHSAVLAPAAAASSVVFDNSTDGSGAQKNKLVAPANGNSSDWHAGSGDGVYFEKGLYATLSGASAVVTFEVSV